MFIGIHQVEITITYQLISIIICSRSPSIPDALLGNIRATIGVEYELIVIDNSQNQYSIFEAYNIGVAKSKYAILCFMHDDIWYHTQNWGQKVIHHFKHDLTGAIGVAGSPYAPQMAGSWWGGKLVNQSLVNTDGPAAETVMKSVTGKVSVKNQVVVLDGIWMCVRKSLFSEISFDSHSYTGYHFYDVDIAMQISRLGYEIYCVYDVLLAHFSKGDMNRNWVENALIFRNKWKRILPVSCTTLSHTVRCNAELDTLREYTGVMASNNYPPKNIYRLAIVQMAQYYKGYFHYKTPLYLFRYFFKYLAK